MGAILRTRRLDASNGGPWTYEKTIAATRAGPRVLRSASPPHGQEAPNDRLRMSLNRHLIFARLLRSRSADTIRKPRATGAYTTPRDIMPMTSAAHSAPTLLHQGENSTAPLDAPRPRRGAAQADRSAAPRVRPVVASVHCAALNFKREAASPHHVEISTPAHRARKAP